MTNRNYYHDYLAHHGVKGMKWGVRRYQNKDGSLTPAGRKKYGQLGSDPNNLSKIDKTAMRRASTQTVYFGKKEPGDNQKKVIEQYRKEASNTKEERRLTQLDKEIPKIVREYNRTGRTDAKLEAEYRTLTNEYRNLQYQNSVAGKEIAKKYVGQMNEALVKDLDFKYTKAGAEYLTNNRLGWDETYLYNKAWFG